MSTANDPFSSRKKTSTSMITVIANIVRKVSEQIVKVHEVHCVCIKKNSLVECRGAIEFLS